MGLSLAGTARRRGAKVILVSGPVSFDPPYGVETIAVESTRDMREAVVNNIDRCQVLVKSAAPGDFRPAERVTGKVKKTELPQPINLARNPDILAEVGAAKGDKIMVGFAAESENLIENANKKLTAKNLGSDRRQPDRPGRRILWRGNQTGSHIIDREGRIEETSLMVKEEVAHRIWDRVVGLFKREELKQ